VSQRPEAIAAAAWRTWIMNEQSPTAVSVNQLNDRSARWEALTMALDLLRPDEVAEHSPGR
jgi:hypothetical protein